MTTQRDIKRGLRKLIPNMYVEEEEVCKSVYLGSYMFLDPCGRYHNVLSPNGVTKQCERFWDNLEKAAEELGGWIESGEGDPTDIFFCLPKEK